MSGPTCSGPKRLSREMLLETRSSTRTLCIRTCWRWSSPRSARSSGWSGCYRWGWVPVPWHWSTGWAGRLLRAQPSAPRRRHHGSVRQPVLLRSRPRQSVHRPLRLSPVVCSRGRRRQTAGQAPAVGRPRIQPRPLDAPARQLPASAPRRSRLVCTAPSCRWLAGATVEKRRAATWHSRLPGARGVPQPSGRRRVGPHHQPGRRKLLHRQQRRGDRRLRASTLRSRQP